MEDSVTRWIRYRREHFFISPYIGRPGREGEKDLWQGDCGWHSSPWDNAQEEMQKTETLLPHLSAKDFPQK